MSRDYEAMQAWTAKWNGSAAIAALITGGIGEKDRVEPRPTQGSSIAFPKIPAAYAVLACEPAGGNKISSTGEIDYRMLTVTIHMPAARGGLAQLKLAMAAVDAAFSDDAATFPANALSISTPNVAWMRTERNPGGFDKIEKDEETTQDGQWWKGTMKWKLHISRMGR